MDNIYARRDITDLLAKRVINAGTGDVRFTISRHGFADGNACLYCNYLNKLNYSEGGEIYIGGSFGARHAKIKNIKT